MDPKPPTGKSAEGPAHEREEIQTLDKAIAHFVRKEAEVLKDSSIPTDKYFELFKKYDAAIGELTEKRKELLAKRARPAGVVPSVAEVPEISTPDAVVPTSTPDTSTPKEKRNAFFDRQYSQDNPDYTSPRTEPTPPPPSWSWTGEDSEDAEPEPYTETFSTDFIRERIESLLVLHKNIKEVKDLEVEGSGDKITVTAKVAGKKGPITVQNIDVQIVLGSEKGRIIVKNHTIKASSFQGLIEETIVSKFGEISEILRIHIEKEEKEKGEVEKIEIVNGKLKVTFGPRIRADRTQAGETVPNRPYKEGPSVRINLPEGGKPRKTDTEFRSRLAEGIRAQGEEAGEKERQKQTEAKGAEKGAVVARLREQMEIIRSEGEKGKTQIADLRRRLAESRARNNVETPILRIKEETKKQTPIVRDIESKLSALREKLRRKWLGRRELRGEITKLEDNAGALAGDAERNPFKYHLIDRLHPTNFRVLFNVDREDITVERINQEMSGERGDESGKLCQYWGVNYITPEGDNAISVSSNGFYLRLTNIDAVKDKDGVRVWDEGARYDLVGPDNEIVSSNLNYHAGQDLLRKKAEEYQAEQLAVFERWGGGVNKK